MLLLFNRLFVAPTRTVIKNVGGYDTVVVGKLVDDFGQHFSKTTTLPLVITPIQLPPVLLILSRPFITITNFPLLELAVAKVRTCPQLELWLAVGFSNFIAA